MGEYNYFKRPVYDDDTQIRRSWDIEDIKKVAHKNAFFEMNGERARALEECWVSETENKATASYGRNWGYYIGMDEIKRGYVDNAPPDCPGRTLAHPMSTWAIELAEDGKTAKGLWYSMAQETYGPGEAYWFGEKIGIDFIREADGWKIWHLFSGIDFFCRVGESIEKQPCDIDVSDDNPLEHPAKKWFGTPTLPMLAYDTRLNWSHYPPLPTPHKSFAETISCGPEGNPNYRGQEG
ncbi:MAG: nuclear transport factor 2 family protein [Oscillospiraceae bacterium]|jgi:hypothetical protein